ncbi:Protein tyrosine phosphatase type IVA 3 [Lobulomyces angularis]|nr:Protein tyrosine phosphatase type IVA 3 [Lobulomyces angularis]
MSSSPISPSPPSMSNENSNSSQLPNIPFNRVLSPIEYKNLKFLVLDCPTEQTIHQYVKELKSRGVTDVVRVCEPTYNKIVFEQVGINVFDWPFKDGGLPPAETIANFLNLCDERFVGGLVSSKDELNKGTEPVIAVHCVAGLGRAPVLVAIAFIEAGMVPLDTIEYVRRRRRGAFNSIQLQWLVDTYKRQWGKKSSRKIGFGHAGKRPSSPSSSRDGNDNQNSEVNTPPSKESTSILGKLFKFNKKNNSSTQVGLVTV